MSVKSLVILRNSPNQNANMERVLQKTTAALETALEQVGNSLERPGRADELKRILRIVLNLSRAKGTYEGLCEGRRLHEFESRIEANPPLRYLTKRIRKFPEATGAGKDSKLCAYMDRQIGRLRALRTVDEKEMPRPLPSWGADSWVEALRKKPSAVSKYISEARNTVLSGDFTFLLAWERIGKRGPSGGPKKDVSHRDLHLDKIYNRNETK